MPISHPLHSSCDVDPEVRLEADLGSTQHAALQHNWSESGSFTELQQQAVAAAEVGLVIWWNAHACPSGGQRCHDTVHCTPSCSCQHTVTCQGVAGSTGPER